MGGRVGRREEGKIERNWQLVPICLLVAYLTLMTLLLWCDSVCASCTILGSTTTTVLWQPWASRPCHPLEERREERREAEVRAYAINIFTLITHDYLRC